MQALSGTGALRIGAAFLANAMPKTTKVYISNPTWPNHETVFKHSGLENQVQYPYYKGDTNSLNFEGMMEALEKAEPKSIVLLHGCAHNPTGVDPTKEQWLKIVTVCKSRHLVPFLDLAYQGFATGNLEDDAFAVRLFASEGLEFLVAESFAKNAGLYSERIGALHVVCGNVEQVPKVLSNLQIFIRGMFSNPPAQGARIMGRILKNPAYLAEWKVELKKVSERIQDMRKKLFKALVAIGTPGNWEHILTQIGMFSYTGLSEDQCKLMMEKHHVYLMLSGRISMAGINESNVEYLANAIKDVVISKPKA